MCDAILADAGQIVLAEKAAGRLDGWRYQLLEERLVGLSQAQATCERLRPTPAPFAYSLLLHRTAYLFCSMLPFGLVGRFGLGAPIIVAGISDTFFGRDALGDELEDPFGVEPNDLPLDALVRTIERDVVAALGEPPPLMPDRSLCFFETDKETLACGGPRDRRAGCRGRRRRRRRWSEGGARGVVLNRRSDPGVRLADDVWEGLKRSLAFRAALKDRAGGRTSVKIRVERRKTFRATSAGWLTFVGSLLTMLVDA